MAEIEFSGVIIFLCTSSSIRALEMTMGMTSATQSSSSTFPKCSFSTWPLRASMDQIQFFNSDAPFLVSRGSTQTKPAMGPQSHDLVSMRKPFMQ